MRWRGWPKRRPVPTDHLIEVSYAQAETQSICTFPLALEEGLVPVLSATSVCSTQCMAVSGTRCVVLPTWTPSSLNTTDPGFHSMTVVCQSPGLITDLHHDWSDPVLESV